MPEPIELLILQNLQAALGAIDAYAGTGYHYTVAGTAVKLDPNHEVDELIAPEGPRPFVVLEAKPEIWQMVEAPLGLRLVLPVTIHWVHESDPVKDADRMTVYYRGCADIERAIAVDLSRGGRAVDTRIVRRTFEAEPDSAQVWAMVDVEIPVYRTYGQPDA